MKHLKYILITLGLILVVFACEKDEDLITPQEEAEVTTDEVAKETHTAPEALNQFAELVHQALKKPAFRKFLRAENGRRVDGDYNMLIGFSRNREVIPGVELIQFFRNLERETLNPTALADGTLTDRILEDYPLVQLAIPAHMDVFDPEMDMPILGIKGPDFTEARHDTILGLDARGKTVVLSTEVVPNEPVVVLGINERMKFEAGQYTLDPGLISTEGFDIPGFPGGPTIIVPPGGSGGSGGPGGDDNTGGGSGEPGSGPCQRNYGFTLYLDRLKSENLSAVESWISGAPEFRLYVYGAEESGFSLEAKMVYNNLFEPNKRDDVNNKWWSVNTRLFNWYNSLEPIVYFYWIEENGGLFDPEASSIKIDNVTIPVPLLLKSNDKVIGSYPVSMGECFGSEVYGGPVLRFTISTR